MILTTAILGVAGFAIFRNMAQPQAVGQPDGFQLVSAQPSNTNSLKNALLGGIGDSLSQSNSGLGGLLGALFNGGGNVAENVMALATPNGGNIGMRLKSDLMRDFGFENNQAAGIVGNLDHESAGFKTLQEIQPMEYRNGVLVASQTARGGFGFAQWTGSRRRAFEAWAAENRLNPTSYAANYGFLKLELKTTEKRAVNAVRVTQTTEDATVAFEKSFLRAGIKRYPSRIERARRYA